MTYMFEEATTFNQDISTWNVTSVTNLEGMFLGAASFDQNLCAWGSRLPPDAVVTEMFVGTACPVMDDPDLSANPPGPFCHTCM